MIQIIKDQDFEGDAHFEGTDIRVWQIIERINIGMDDGSMLIDFNNRMTFYDEETNYLDPRKNKLTVAMIRQAEEYFNLNAGEILRAIATKSSLLDHYLQTRITSHAKQRRVLEECRQVGRFRLGDGLLQCQASYNNQRASGGW